MNITLNEDQKQRLTAAGFYGLADDPEEILFYTHSVLEKLEAHNKNYTKDQYYGISALNDIFTALYKGF